MRVALVAAFGLVAYAAYRWSQDAGGTDAASDAPAEVLPWGESWLPVPDDVLQSVETTASGAVDTVNEFLGGMMNIGNIQRATPAMLGNANMQAFLAVIRAGEGTADAGGYNRLYGGGSFSSFADHPRQKVTAGGITSTAAGAYQFLASSWDEVAKKLNLADFSPANQDYAAVGLIAKRGALDDVLQGRFDVAIKKCAKEWASLPGSPYGQPTISMERARAVYMAAGGLNSGSIYA